MPPRDTPSLARDWFQGFLDALDKVAFLRGLVNSDPLTFETEWLEFKPYPYTNTEDTIKEIWSKNLSAFGNTAGGVLVWGIGARKVRKVDAARSIQFVPDPDELRTRLYELHHQATDPPLPGIDVRAISDPGEGGKGFVVCSIPQGEFVPYRAEHSAKQYYVRVGDDSIVPHRVMLRRLFYPQSLARLEMSVVVMMERKIIQGIHVIIMKYEAYITNAGTASADDAHVVVLDNVKYDSGSGLYSAVNWAKVASGSNKNSFHSVTPIHPGFSGLVATSHVWQPTNHIIVGNTTYPNIRPIGMRFHIYHRDSEAMTFQVAFDKKDFEHSDLVEKKCRTVEDSRWIPLGEMS
jgi:hypothetical protein